MQEWINIFITFDDSEQNGSLNSFNLDPARKALTSDWSGNSFVMVAYDNYFFKFSQIFFSKAQQTISHAQ